MNNFLTNIKYIKGIIIFIILIGTLIGIFFLKNTYFDKTNININYNNKQLEKINSLDVKNNKFAFAVMGDNRDGDNVLKEIIDRINQDNDIKLGLNNGDLVPDGYRKEYFNYINLIKDSKKPFLSVIGNHEIPWYDGKTSYEHAFGKRYFSFVLGNSYFIVLDDSNEKGLDEKQIKWLENELKKSDKYQSKFVFFHVPLYDPRKGKLKEGHSLSDLVQVKRINDLFDKHKVSMIFSSHIHFYYKGIWQKTPFIITGGGGAPLKKYKNNGFYHYIKVIVNGDYVEYKVVKINVGGKNIIDDILEGIKDTFNLN